MAFLTTQTEEMLAAEAALSAANTNLAAQDAGAAPATTVVAPAAADPVSVQQAAIFSAYGAQYQTIAAEAQTLMQNYAQTLGISSGSYGNTEAVNAAQAVLSNSSSLASPLAAPAAPAAPGGNPLDILQYLLGGTGNYSTGLGGPFSLSGNLANIFNIGGGNWASSGSALLGLAGGGLLDTSAADAAGSAADAAGLADTTAPMAGGGMAGGGMAGLGAPVAAAGQATMVGKLSVPPTWAGSATPVVGTSAAPLETVGWTAAAPQAGPGTVIPGMPGVGTAARNSAGFGAPRYGVKPIVMPKPATV